MNIKFYSMAIAAFTLVGCETQVSDVAQADCEALVQENSSLKYEIESLRSENTALTNKKSDLEYQLSKVEHYDEDLNTKVSLPAKSSTSTLFTGSVIETSIDGEFEGWEGETIFKMMNGTIWQQASYSYTYHYAYMPSVMIYRKSGTFYMKVEGVSDEIAVRQIK